MRQNSHASYEEIKKKFRPLMDKDIDALNEAVNTRLIEAFPVNSDTTCAVEYLQSIKFKCFTSPKIEFFDESVVPNAAEHIRCQQMEPNRGTNYMTDTLLEIWRKWREEGTLTKNQRRRLHRLESGVFSPWFTLLWEVRIYYEDGLLTGFSSSVRSEGP